LWKRDEWWKYQTDNFPDIESRVGEYYRRNGRNIIILDLLSDMIETYAEENDRPIRRENN